jgi:hypothetical protein
VKATRLALLLVIAAAAVFATRAYWRWANTPLSRIDVSDDSDRATLSPIWQTNRMQRGALTIQSEIVRAGRSAAKFVLRSGDTFEAGIKEARTASASKPINSSRAKA